MMESDDLLFPIEEVVDNAAVEKLKSESGSFPTLTPKDHTHLLHGSMLLTTNFSSLVKKRTLLYFIFLK